MRNFSCFIFLFIVSFTIHSKDFTFVVLGDTRPPIGKNRNDYTNFIKQMDEIKSFNPGLVINLGDLISGYDKKPADGDWTVYKSIISKYDFKYYQIPGNHDVSSLKSEDIYQKEFSPLYYSFDQDNNHFVMLDNSERSIWGYISDKQYTWLKNDLKANKKKNIFVFMHVAPWYKVLVDKKYNLFWKNYLHPLFVSNKVTAVFAGHIHQYGPTYDLDGIKYFITAGGGAELMKSYKNYGGNYHFMTVTLSGNNIDYRVIQEGKSLTDEQADVRKNHIFEEKNTNRLTINYDDLVKDRFETTKLFITNPYYDDLLTDMQWTYDKNVFKITPEKINSVIGPFKQESYRFKIELIEKNPGIYNFPSIACKVKSGNETNYFEKDLAIKRYLHVVKKDEPKITFSGKINEWEKFTKIELSDENDKNKSGTVYLNYDRNYIYIAAKVLDSTINSFFDGNMIFLNDMFMIGFDADMGGNSYDTDDMQLEFSKALDKVVVYDRTNGDTVEYDKKGIKCIITRSGNYLLYEIAMPVSMIQPVKIVEGSKFGFNCAVVYSIDDGANRLIEWQPGIGGGLGIDNKFRSHQHFGIVVLE
jgi:3',5'-cyclic AMP phosphodiesterase CpdA